MHAVKQSQVSKGLTLLLLLGPHKEHNEQKTALTDK